MDLRRITLGAISLAFILIGVLAYCFGWEGVIFWVLLRSGLLLGAIWLALPELTSQESKLTTPILILSVVLIIIMATRPKLFFLFGTLAIAGFLLQGVVRRFTKGLKK
jgi:hypothetical protein